MNWILHKNNISQILGKLSSILGAGTTLDGHTISMTLLLKSNWLSCCFLQQIAVLLQSRLAGHVD